MIILILSPNANVLFWQNTTSTSESENMFNNALIALAPAELHGKLKQYLSTDPEHITDILTWWYDRRAIYPHLHRMALNYLMIPGVWNATALK